MKNRILLLLLLIAIQLKAEEISRQQVIMGTFATLKVEKKDKKYISKAFNLMKKIEKSLSSYDKESLLYQLNKKRKIKADPYLFEAISKSKRYYKLSHGYFDITIGSLTKKLYHFGEEERLPTQEEINHAKLNMNAIKVQGETISLEENITLDLGGMGKGYAVDKVANYLREQNISHAIVVLSGDIQALHPTTIYLDSPFSSTIFAKLTTRLPNLSVSTSGTYRRFIKDKAHHHLLNPKTKKQGRSFVSITLLTSKNNTKIDAMATAIGVMSVEEALNFLKRHQEIGYILVRPNGDILQGNSEKLITIEWI